MGDDDDLKGAALLFASAAGKHITGQILAVDGGVSSVHGGLSACDALSAPIPFVEHARHRTLGFGGGEAECGWTWRDELTSTTGTWRMAAC